MKHIPFFFLPLMVAILFSSCAGTYKTMDTAKQAYGNPQQVGDQLEISYQYDLYAKHENRKYSKKEKKLGYRAIAVEIRNLSDQAITLSQERLSVYAEDQQLQIEELDAYLLQVKQASGSYLLHTLWAPWSVEVVSDTRGNSGGRISFLPIGLVVGVINALVANKANNKHAEDLKRLVVWGKTVSAGETLTGIICLRYDNFGPLVFKYQE